MVAGGCDRGSLDHGRTTELTAGLHCELRATTCCHGGSRPAHTPGDKGEAYCCLNKKGGRAAGPLGRRLPRWVVSAPAHGGSLQAAGAGPQHTGARVPVAGGRCPVPRRFPSSPPWTPGRPVAAQRPVLRLTGSCPRHLTDSGVRGRAVLPTALRVSSSLPDFSGDPWGMSPRYSGPPQGSHNSERRLWLLCHHGIPGNAGVLRLRVPGLEPYGPLRMRHLTSHLIRTAVRSFSWKNCFLF